MSDPAEAKRVRRLAAIVFTDVVGYSARMQADEAGTLVLVQADFEVMRRLGAQHGGQVLKSTGDGLLMCFDSVVDAVTCALEIQAGFASRGTGALQHRIGIHLGDVYHRDGDVVGDGVNLAARLQTAAQPGAICVSDTVFAAVKGKVPMESIALDPLLLKNIAQPVAAYLMAPVGTGLVVVDNEANYRRARKLSLVVVGVAMLAGAAWVYFRRTGPSVAPAVVTTASAPATAAFPLHPDLKRARALIFDVDSIPEDFALADDLVKPLLAKQPNDPEVVVVAAEVATEYVSRGVDITQARRAQAQKLAERAVQLAPENPAALAVLGRYLRSAGTQLARAEEVLRKAIKLEPTEPRYYRLLFAVLIGSKPGAETDAFGRHMAELFPNDVMIRYEAAVQHMMADDLKGAEENFDRTLELAPLATAIAWKAKIMLEVHGDIEGMVRALDRTPERQRTDLRFATSKMIEATVTGRTASARQALDAINDSWLTNGTYVFPKAMLLGDLDAMDGKDDVARLDYEAALKEIDRVQAADPTDLRPQRAALWVHLGLGPSHREEALAALRLNLQKAQHPYHWHIGMGWWTGAPRACLLLGEKAEALTLLKEACSEANGRLLLRNLFKVDPKMANFRDDPEIVALLKEPEAHH